MTSIDPLLNLGFFDFEPFIEIVAQVFFKDHETQPSATSLPFGLDSLGLPVGLHLVAGKCQDLKALYAAQLLERYLPPLTPPY